MKTESLEFDPLSRASLAEQVAGALKAHIGKNLKANDPLPSMRALCRQFDVSINTVQSAIATLAREGIVQKRQGRGVYVAARASRGRIGILSELDLLDSRISPYWRSTASALKSRLEADGYTPQLYIGHAEPGPGMSDEPTCPRFWEDAAAGRLDGAVILDVPSTAAWHTRVSSCPIPVIGAMTSHSVSNDYIAITRAAVARLAAQGCRRLGLIAWRGNVAFVDAVQRHGLTTCDAWVRDDLDPAVRGAGWDEFREIWSTPEKPDGLVILDDMLFADAQLAMLELGIRVPDALHLAVAISRNASPPLRLPLTAFEIDPVEMAAETVAMLRQRLSGELSAPVVRYLPFRELVMAPERTPAAATKGTPGVRAASVAPDR